MDADQTARYQKWIQEKWKHGPCPVCKVAAWFTGSDVLLLSPQHTPNSGAYPLLPIYCTNCGYTLLINTLIGRIDFPAGNEPS